MHGCVGRLPVLDPTCSGSDLCSVDNRAQTKPLTDAAVCHQSQTLLQFVVPVKRNALNNRNEGLKCDKKIPHVNVARPVIMPVVMQTLSRTLSLSDKYLCAFSDKELPNLNYDISNANDLHFSLEGQVSVAKPSERNIASEPQVKESQFVDTKNDGVAKNEMSVTVNAGDVHQHQTFAAAALTDEAIDSRSSDVNEHSSLPYLPEKVVKTHDQSMKLSLTNDDVRMQRIIRKNSQLKRIADKSRLTSSKVSPGNLWMLRNNGKAVRLSLKDAVGGTRPHAYSISQVCECHNYLSLNHSSGKLLISLRFLNPLWLLHQEISDLFQ